jgi:threonine/homoserine/homoserine lactone efflux protein
MEASAWIQVAAVCAAGAASPGPSLAVVVRNTVSGGRARGVATGLGHGLGVGLYAFAAVAGVSAVVARSPGLHRAIEVGGAAYLAWLGAMAWKHAGEGAQGAVPRGRSGFGEGFAIAFLNPKIAVFFLALLGSFLPAHADLGERAGVAALAAGIDAGWYSFAALVLAATGAAEALQQHRGTTDRALGAILIAVAVGLLAG